ncbi:hypothetical protein HMPREF3132_09155 [Staphylococcus sp. HMSC14C08]|nr:hypothetical protein HMPREF3116_07815 [Aerococcus sp. HMSC10H05]OFU78289.1 hypothetical protein HMPREF3109_01550 [Staphylococcus sp. HMSC10B09]OFV21749.1 hypothetical protein HMPREF3131_08070 [Staphylococcus sp. HMSC14C01]OFV23690.1 hypothetical protein HMPREF3132_09155 [Staphylococcus sp. HMSC14C08]OFV26259.1 hypothetical protein HMPREF3134_11395 [Staphylococcus sp. HMSC14D10]OFV28484.1 hypothetical protein HMPREF3133_03910 [Staphylococcus sp. HMSC14D01]
MGHYVPAVTDKGQVLLPLFDRGYLQPQGRWLGSLRDGKRRESRRPAATQRDRRAVFARAAGAALGQRCADEIGDVVKQDV